MWGGLCSEFYVLLFRIFFNRIFRNLSTVLAGFPGKKGRFFVRAAWHFFFGGRPPNYNNFIILFQLQRYFHLIASYLNIFYFKCYFLFQIM